MCLRPAGGSTSRIAKIRARQRFSFHHPKDPAVLKTLRDSELLRRSVFTTPPIFTTVWTPLWGKKCQQNQGDGVSTGGVAIANHCAIVKSLRIVNSLRRSLFCVAGSFGHLRAVTTSTYTLLQVSGAISSKGKMELKQRMAESEGKQREEIPYTCKDKTVQRTVAQGATGTGKEGQNEIPHRTQHNSPEVFRAIVANAFLESPFVLFPPVKLALKTYGSGLFYPRFCVFFLPVVFFVFSPIGRSVFFSPVCFFFTPGQVF